LRDLRLPINLQEDEGLFAKRGIKLLIPILELFFFLLTILLGCELFSNGIEWAGKKLKLGEGVVGSIMAAVGTALPETMVPIMALFFGRSGKSIEIGVGAIVGAPFMLATLAFFITGASVLIYSATGRRTTKMRADPVVIGRDIRYFLVVYTIAIAVVILDNAIIRYITAGFLLAAYGYYV
jgi:cation:H+ antiporter